LIIKDLKSRESSAADEPEGFALARYISRSNRVGLVNERYERILLIQKYIHTIRRQARALEKDIPPSVAEILRDLISYEMTALRALRDKRQPSALLSRQLTNEFFASGDGMPANLR